MNMHPISDKELIEKFLRGELLENEQLAFEERKADTKFLALLEETVISYKGRLSLKEKLQTIGEDLKAENSRPKNTSMYWISGIAATVLFLFSIFYFWNQSLSNHELFETYFEVYPNAYSKKGNNDTNVASKKAFDFYDAENYSAAASTFETITQKRNLNSSEHFYYGVSLLSQGDVENAKTQFKHVAEAHPLYSEAQWYTSLSLIKQDSVSKVKTILTNSKIKYNTSRASSIQKLLNELPD